MTRHNGKGAKVLADFTMTPGREDGGWGMCIPHIVAFKGTKDIYRGPNVKVENNSTKAIRVVVYDMTDEYRAEQLRIKEKAERKKLAELKKKYESK